jgi:ComF family protein
MRGDFVETIVTEKPERRWFTGLFELAFPPACVTCRDLLSDGERYVCPDCRDRISRIVSPLCTRCGRPFFTPDDRDHLCGGCIISPPPFDVARSLGVYGDVMLPLVQLFKYHRRFHLAETLTRLMADGSYPGFSPEDFDVIVPVPLHTKRLRERGYNQSLLLARGLGDAWGMPVDGRGLRRTRWTEPQVNLTLKEREENVRGAFAVRDAAPKGRLRLMAGVRRRRHLPIKDAAVLLVDDVYTTGATVRECARVLAASGARRVGVLTAARVVVK